MAVKPITLPNKWAIDGVYATGPFIGSVSSSDPGVGIAGEGHRPGASYPTAAEHENYQQLHLTTWTIDWLAQGSSLGAADAHIVETDATGRTVLRAMTITNTVDETGFVMTSVNTVQPAVSVACTTGATIFSAAMGNAAGKGFQATVGSGAGQAFDATLLGSASGARGFIADLIGAAFGAYGVLVSSDNTTSAVGIRSTHAGAGYAMEAISTGIIAALNVTATTASTVAAFISGGSTHALQVTSSATAAANAIRALAGNVSGYTIRSYVAAGATSAARAFYASVTDDAIAAEFVAAGNAALVVTGDTTAPVFGPLKITECNAVPTSTVIAQFANVRRTVGVAAQLMSSCPEDGGWRGHLTTTGGSALAQDYDATSTFVGAVGVWATAINFSAYDGDAPKTPGGQVLVRINLNARSGVVASDVVLGLRIIDITAGGGVVWTRSGLGVGPGVGWRIVGNSAGSWGPPISVVVPLTVPTAENYNWRLEYQMSSGSLSLYIRDVSVDFLGML